MLVNYNFIFLVFKKMCFAMRKYLLLSVLLASYSVLTPQSVEQIKADRQSYIWGEGRGPTQGQADQEALAMLINQISAQVESQFTLLKEEVSNAGGTSFQEKYKGVISTYSSATLTNTERILISPEPDARIFRFIKRSDLDKIFADRERKIVEFARSGEQFIERGEVAFALRYLYWSLTLLRSHPRASSISMIDAQGSERLLVTWLPMQINSIFSDIRIAVTDTQRDGDLTRYILSIHFRGKPARNFDYSYWSGRDWTNTHSSRDGIGIAEFVGAEARSEIRFKAEYVFQGETAIDHELRDVMNKIDVVPFRSSFFTVPIGATPAAQQGSTVAQSTADLSRSVTLVANPQRYQDAMSSIVNAINSRNFESVRHHFTPEGFSMYQKLLQYGQARIIGKPEFKFVHFEGGVMCRALPMSFHYRNNNRTFQENVVFRFNSQGKVSSLALGLAQEALAEIIDRDVWSERVRLILINFLENYKTAFALERIDYIESIFADDALIIVGEVLRTKTTGDNPFRNNQIVTYNRRTKEEYISRLRNSFASQEFINIRFEDNIIRKSGRGGEVYGIQIRQHYFSSTYGDSGYLFLMVDVNNPDQPVIHVRTWQPHRNPDGSIYGLGDF